MTSVRALALDTSGDIAIANGRPSFVIGAEYVAQKMQSRFRTILGEWFMDKRVGVPYVDFVDPGYDLSLIQSTLTRVAQETPGVLEILGMTLEVDRSTRQLVAIVECKLDPAISDDTYEWTFTDLIL